MDKRTKEYKQSLLGAESKNESLFRVSLKINDTVYTAEDEDLEQAILQLNPAIFKTFAYLTIAKGDKEVEFRFNIFQCKRLFANDSMRKVKCSMYKNLFV